MYKKSNDGNGVEGVECMRFRLRGHAPRHFVNVFEPRYFDSVSAKQYVQ